MKTLAKLQRFLLKKWIDTKEKCMVSLSDFKMMSEIQPEAQTVPSNSIT